MVTGAVPENHDLVRAESVQAVRSQEHREEIFEMADARQPSFLDLYREIVFLAEEYERTMGQRGTIVHVSPAVEKILRQNQPAPIIIHGLRVVGDGEGRPRIE